MKKLTTKTISTAINIHTTDQNTIVDFLNNNSKELGAINYLGAFIDDIKITRDYGIKAKNEFLIVERNLYSEENPGNDYTNSGSSTPGIFEFSFRLPNTFPSSSTVKENFIMLSTIKNHSCNPKMDCSSCNASGKCRPCDARGYNRCNSCSGTGKKEVRDGKFANGNPKYKKVACSTCHGSGKNSCNSCDGTKKCYNCKGSGIVTCDRCNGTSVFQTYQGYSNTLVPVITNTYFSEYPNLIEAIKNSKNKTSFKDDLIEYESINKVILDNAIKCIEANKHAILFTTDLAKEANLQNNQKIGRVHTTVENVPITNIEFSFEDKPYNINIVGENNIVCFEEIPKKQSYRAGYLTRLISFFNKKKRLLAFLHTASYMFNSDDHISEEEIVLFDIVLNKLKINQIEKNKIIEDFKIKKPLDSILPLIKVVKKDKRALIFAWHCVIQDKEIKDVELKAFNDLASYFNIKEPQIDLIKRKAQQFSALSSEQMLEEYFR